MKILTGFAIVNDRNGKRVTYTYDIIDGKGNIKDSNKKESYIILDVETKEIVETLEDIIENRMNEVGD